MKSHNFLFVMPLAAGLALIVGCGEKSEKSDNSNDYDVSKAAAQLSFSGEKHRERITQARADMSSIRTAFEQMYREYGTMAKHDSSTTYKLGGVSFTKSSNGDITIGKIGSGNKYDSSTKDDYCKVIAELCVPEKITPSLNKKNIKMLDPKKEYDASKGPTEGDNPDHTWLDPWGNPYMIRINVDSSETVTDPSKSDKKLSARIILWSLGPDGKGGTPETDRDNVASWKDGGWFD